jgi:DNA repair protein RecO
VSAIIKSDAVVLRTVKFGESSRIVTFFTENYGKIAGMVKGARRPGNRFGSTLQPMSQVSVVIYRKPGRDVQTVSQCDHAWTHRRIATDLDRISVGMQMVELVGMVLHDEEENRELYALLSGALRVLDGETILPWALFYDFEVQLAGALGFRTDFQHCAGCGRPVADFPGTGENVKIDIARGGPVCRMCDSPSVRGVFLPPEELNFLIGLTPGTLTAGPAARPGMPGQSSSGRRSGPLEKLISEYFAFHLPGYRKLRSGEVFRSRGPA